MLREPAPGHVCTCTEAYSTGSITTGQSCYSIVHTYIYTAAIAVLFHSYVESSFQQLTQVIIAAHMLFKLFYSCKFYQILHSFTYACVRSININQTTDLFISASKGTYYEFSTSHCLLCVCRVPTAHVSDAATSVLVWFITSRCNLITV